MKTLKVCLLLVAILITMTSAALADSHLIVNGEISWAIEGEAGPTAALVSNVVLGVLPIVGVAFIALVGGYVAFEAVLYSAKVVRSFYRTSRGVKLPSTDIPAKIKRRSPEFLLLVIADLLPKKQRKILQQEARDLREEYDEAIIFLKIGRARMIVLSYYGGFFISAFWWIVEKLIEILIKIFK
jgi:hypothetical protein